MYYKCRFDNNIGIIKDGTGTHLHPPNVVEAHKNDIPRYLRANLYRLKSYSDHLWDDDEQINKH